MKKPTAVSAVNRISELFEARFFCNSVGISEMSKRCTIIDVPVKTVPAAKNASVYAVQATSEFTHALRGPDSGTVSAS